jgi:hypothetical protein
VELWGDSDKCGVCLGQLKYPTDHVYVGVNDMSLCFKQGKTEQYHLNLNDLVAAINMVSKALEARHQTLPAWLLNRLNQLPDTAKTTGQNGMQRAAAPSEMPQKQPHD